MTGPRLCVTVPEGPHYRSDALAAGAAALAMSYTRETRIDPRPGDALVTWNLHRGQLDLAARFRSKGAAVIVMENGYIGQDEHGHQLYAMARNGHNGSGRWLIGDVSRWDRFCPPAVERIDYNRTGYTLVIGQRGIGSPTMRSPAMWEDTDGRVAAERYWPGQPIKVRRHPGRVEPPNTLEADLAGAARVLIWSSACGVAALVRGIPVYYAAPFWAGSPSAVPFDRMSPEFALRWPVDTWPARRAIAWAQWSLEEIASGTALGRLLMLQ